MVPNDSSEKSIIISKISDPDNTPGTHDNNVIILRHGTFVLILRFQATIVRVRGDNFRGLRRSERDMWPGRRYTCVDE